MISFFAVGEQSADIFFSLSDTSLYKRLIDYFPSLFQMSLWLKMVYHVVYERRTRTHNYLSSKRNFTLTSICVDRDGSRSQRVSI